MDTGDWHDSYELIDTIFLNEGMTMHFNKNDEKVLSRFKDLKFSDSPILKTRIEMLVK